MHEQAPRPRDVVHVGRTTTEATSICSSNSRGSDRQGASCSEVLGLSVELSELLDARVDVVTPRTLRPEVRDVALADAVAL